ncbi:Gfo/Idh/MocA family oxidoreductase [Rhodocaloribacter litoris]|uniref:Gfo/Idh/MocA family oxidoreductase n=1 Tax=Rhodocaloribacter litoris TaxID=2558931 RepID=UPI0014228D46|nr:Gfo/Idh/MocA family oxidoreductase [Rhodocaloribacter litoris]QXD14229.1 Gfo/Idh/MocA family oxidoreductase [Rhodocaloribacter litoris]GIV59896.1 MAG: alpha-N-acetylgalactosaminidase [Rhodothermaceae bacterium]
MDRRTFLKAGAVAGVGASVGGARAFGQEAPAVLRRRSDQTVRLGFIGVGLRGREHLRLALHRDDVHVAALCDIDPDALARAQALVAEAGRPAPPVFTGDDYAFLDLLAMDALDAVIIATPWLWHVPMAVAAMRAGKYAGLEVPAAVTLDECWDLVDTYEATGVPCMILENVCYRRDVMAVLNMVRQGLFGELVHLECGYQHDLRHVKFNDGRQPYGGGVEFGEKGFSEAKWRTLHSVHRNGDLYPTHGVGPVATMLDINRGNRFVSLTSTATKSRGLHDYIVKQAGPDHPNAKVRFKLGDVVTTVIRTQNEETIVVRHDTNLPRPYSLGFRVQGTRGLWMDLNRSIYLEGESPAHQWEPAQPYLERYDHPLWQRYAARAEGAGHGGMDFFVLHAFVEAVRQEAPPPLDVYDAAAWSAVSPLSEQSIAAGGAPCFFPDFTRGQWMKRRPAFALDGMG